MNSLFQAINKFAKLVEDADKKSARHERIEKAMFEGDNSLLNSEFPCECCCEEHTSETCPAREWGGCRGQHNTHSIEEDEQKWRQHHQERGMSDDEWNYGSDPDKEEAAWVEHMEKERGMSPDEFYGKKTELDDNEETDNVELDDDYDSKYSDLEEDFDL